MLRSITVAALAAATLAAGVSTASAALGDNGTHINGAQPQGERITLPGATGFVVASVELPPVQE